MRRLGTGMLLALLAVCLIASPVFADTPDPDGTPNIKKINIYRNMFGAGGDWLIVIYANIPYATIPATPVTQTFIWKLIDLDGVTELGSTVGYAYNADGYGYNVYSMYFSAADVLAKGMDWLDPFTIQLGENPAVFDTPIVFNYPVVLSDYSTLTVIADVQVTLAARILTIAGDLDNKWGISTLYSLLTQNETATVLSQFGEAFFRGAIYGLQAMAPLAFSVVVRVIDVTDRTWTDNYTVNLTNQWAGTWVETAREAGKALFGTTYDLLSIIMLLVMCGGLMVGNIMLTGDHWNGFIDVSLLAVVAARLGMYDFAFLILIAALCWFYIGTKIWFGMLR